MIPLARRERFLRQPEPIRIGSLAADLARISSFIQVPALEAVTSLIEESRAFIEWTAAELPIDDAAQLVDIQRGLTHWWFIWPEAQHHPEQRRRLAEQAQAWSDQVLAMSGLLEQD